MAGELIYPGSVIPVQIQVSGLVESINSDGSTDPNDFYIGSGRVVEYRAYYDDFTANGRIVGQFLQRMLIFDIAVTGNIQPYLDNFCTLAGITYNL
ncbi:MAG: hypothetical protein K0U41_00520, partial [Gammaproteobacteria bacterium]|nr:hypothetical protein [Gammaproteobacteria bacterium]